MSFSPTVGASHDRNILKEQPGRAPGAAASLHGGVFPHTDAKGHIPVAEKAKPLLADGLLVDQKRLNLCGRHEAKKTLRQCFALGSVRVTGFGQELQEDGVGDTLIADGDHEDVDIGAPKLPVRPIHGGDEVLALRDKLEQEVTKQAKIEGISAHKALNTTLVRGRLGP